MAVQLVRDFAASLTSHADLLARSPIGSPDWVIAEVVTAQTLAAYWQRKLGECLSKWEDEDGSSARSPFLDWGGVRESSLGVERKHNADHQRAGRPRGGLRGHRAGACTGP